MFFLSIKVTTRSKKTERSHVLADFKLQYNIMLMLMMNKRTCLRISTSGAQLVQKKKPNKQIAKQ